MTARKIGVLIFVLAVAVILPAQAGATFQPAAKIGLKCEEGHVVGTFAYSGFNPANQHLVANQTLGPKTKALTFAGPGTTDRMSVRYRGGTVRATTVVVSASGRVKAEAEARIRCQTPPPPERATSARLIGPCGDPMYAAVFNNRRSDVASTFKWRYHAFGSGYTTLVRTIGAGKVFQTGYKHLTGSRWTTIRSHGELLLRKLTAPGGNYPACRR